MSKKEHVDCEVIYVHETADAIGIKETETGEVIWLPKSRVLYERDDDYKRGDIITISVEQWLALREGLI